MKDKYKEFLKLEILCYDFFPRGFSTQIVKAFRRKFKRSFMSSKKIVSFIHNTLRQDETIRLSLFERGLSFGLKGQLPSGRRIT